MLQSFLPIIQCYNLKNILITKYIINCKILQKKDTRATLCTTKRDNNNIIGYMS